MHFYFLLRYCQFIFILINSRFCFARFPSFFAFFFTFNNIQFQVLNDIRNLVGCRLQTFLLHSLIVYVERCCAFDIKYPLFVRFQSKFYPFAEEMAGKKIEEKNKGIKICTMYIRMPGRQALAARHFRLSHLAHFCTLHFLCQWQ